ncbi:MAG: hypothetical protein ACFBSG_01055 [Leptolyngbyaceae cyanobacterium]
MVCRQSLLGLSLASLLIACGSTAPSNTATSTSPKVDDSANAESPQPTSEPEVTDRGESQPKNAQSAIDTRVVPGERVGEVTSDTNRADLAAQFGESALTDTEIPVGEGFTEFGTRVNDDLPTAFAVIWVDASQSAPATAQAFGPAWQTVEGIGVGTTFAELQQILGAFSLYGFGWDYGGTIVLEGSNLSEYYGSLILRLQPADPSTRQTEAAAFEAVQGDRLIASSDPNLLALDLVVSEMIVYLDPPDE